MIPYRSTEHVFSDHNLLEYWSVLAYDRSAKSAHSVKQWLQENKPEQVDQADAVMPEVADDSYDWISQ